MAQRENTADLLDRALGPLFVYLAGFIPKSVHPNTVTLVSGSCGIAAGFVLMLWSHGAAYWAAALLILLYSFLDNMDGVHARATGRASPLGGFVDHAFDAVITPLIYLALLLRFDLTHPLLLFVVYLRSVSNAVAGYSEVATRRLFIPALGPTVESYVTIFLFLSFFFFPGPGGMGPVAGVMDLGVVGLPIKHARYELSVLGIFFLVSFVGNVWGIVDIVRFTIRNRNG